VGAAFERLRPDHCEFIAAQPMFFVATAPSGQDGHVNVSPKGYDTFRILDDSTVAYLDLTGSGAETIAHVRQNGRITIMFCSFDEKPLILRLFGRAEAIPLGDPRFDEVAADLPRVAGARAVIRVALDRVQTSCGYAVPHMEFRATRPRLEEWADHKGTDGLEDYWAAKNRRSIDGIPALDPDEHEGVS
jgi:predicted pyridoxine 5'-phosphate oxidase superfamily flavin-nucleotide-binding protein